MSAAPEEHLDSEGQEQSVAHALHAARTRPELAPVGPAHFVSEFDREVRIRISSSALLSAQEEGKQIDGVLLVEIVEFS